MRIFPILFFSALSCVAQPALQRAIVAQSPPAAGCATTDTALGHDTFLEGFQNNGPENNQSLTITTNANANAALTFEDSSALTTGKPAGACDLAMKIAVNAADTTPSYLRYAWGSDVDVDSGMDIIFYLYIETPPDNGESFTFCQLTTSAGSTVVAFQINQSGANTQLRGTAANSGTYINVSTGTWLQCCSHLDATLEATSFGVAGVSTNTFTRTTGRDLRRFELGAISSLAAGDSATLWVDVICINTP